MKKILILMVLCISITSCGTTNTKLPESMKFEIPDTYTQVDNTWPITVWWDEINLSGEKLRVWDKIDDVLLDMKADYFDQVSTGSLSQFSGYKLIETVPSLDTPVCTKQTKQLEFAAEEFKDVTFIIVSNDTPFALQRFCSANGIDNLKVFSDARTREFGQQNGLLMTDYSLLTRAIMIVNNENMIEYIEYASEVTSELDLMNALAYLKSVAK